MNEEFNLPKQQSILFDVCGHIKKIGFQPPESYDCYINSIAQAREKGGEDEGFFPSLISTALFSLISNQPETNKQELASIIIGYHFSLRPHDATKENVEIDAMGLAVHAGCNPNVILTELIQDERFPFSHIKLTQGEHSMDTVLPHRKMNKFSELQDLFHEHGDDQFKEVKERFLAATSTDKLMADLVSAAMLTVRHTDMLAQTTTLLANVYLELFPEIKEPYPSKVEIDVDYITKKLNIEHANPNFIRDFADAMNNHSNESHLLRTYLRMQELGIEWIKESLERLSKATTVPSDIVEKLKTVGYSIAPITPEDQVLPSVIDILQTAESGHNLIIKKSESFKKNIIDHAKERAAPESKLHATETKQVVH